jgi:hypothetical protein
VAVISPRTLSALGLALAPLLAGGCVKAVPYPVIGVLPVAPLVMHNPNVRSPIVPTVDSRRPTLRWEARTGEGIGYDIRIWRGEPMVPAAGPSIPGQNMIPGEPVYARDGISGSSHTVEIELEPATLYFWTLRERRLIDGQLRVSDWAVLRMDLYLRDDQRLARLPHPGYFRFSTPKL